MKKSSISVADEPEEEHGRSDLPPSGNFNDFDLSKFRVPQEDFSAGAAQKVNAAIRVGKPAKDSFFRVHPDPTYRMEAGLIEFQMESYLVSGEIYEENIGDPALSLRIVIPAITRSGSVFMMVPKSEANNSWTRSFHEAVEIAVTKWIRIKPNMEAGAYEAFAAINQAVEPAWTDMAFEKMIEVAFRGRVISTNDHPILRQLRGE